MKLLPRSDVDFLIDHPGSALALCVDNARTRVLMISISREGGVSTLECPGGAIDPGETPELAAIREVREETGFAVTKSEKLFTLTTSAGITNERVHVFLCEGHLIDRGEYTSTWINLQDVRSYLIDGGISSAATVAALLYLMK